MAVDKTESTGAQADAPKAVTKKTTKKTSDGTKKLSAMQKVVADAKLLYSDLDTSEGRKMRKRPASTHASAVKKPKKAAAKKTPAAKKTSTKKAENGKSE